MKKDVKHRNANQQNNSPKTDRKRFFRAVVKLIFKISLVLVSIFLFLVYSPGLLDINPVYLELPPPRPFTGALEKNFILQKAEKLLNNHIVGPESIAFYNGDLYTGLHNGWIVKIKDDSSVELIVTLGDPKCESWEEDRCGRPLGMRFDENGTLYVVDCYRGLYKVNVVARNFTILYDSSQPVDGKPALVPNDFDLSTSGDVYFSDSSVKFLLKDGIYEFLESGTNGRLLKYEKKTNSTRVLLDGVAFANGVQLSPEEDYLLISETNRNRILKYFLKGEKTGQVEVFIDNLPGAPDNIRSNGKGGYWVPLCVATPPSVAGPLRTLGPHQIIRKALARLIYVIRSVVQYADGLFPSAYAKIIAYKLAHTFPYVSMESSYGLILEIDGNGEIIRSFHSPDGSISYISQVTQYGNALYLGTPWNSYLAKLTI